MQANILVQTASMERNDWLEWRKNGIGGSDVGAIAGANPWKSPISVYLEKIGEAPKAEENERMYWGNVLKNIVAKEFSKRTGFKVQRRNAMYQHPEHEFMLANIDRIYIKDGHVAGILECKTTNEYSKDQWEGDKIPNHYYLQVQHYLAVTGFQEAYIAALIGGNKYVYKKINRDDELIDYFIQIGYKGLIELARRSGQILSITTHAVHENDEFEFQYGLNENLSHKPNIRGDRGEVYCYYAYATLKDGGMLLH